MAENSNNSSRVVTVGSLATFLNNLKSSTFYTRTAVDTMVSNRAVKGGDSAETFKVKDLKLYYDPEENPVTLSPGNGKLTIYQYGGQNMELDLSRGGNIITSNDINPDSKADRINADLYLDAVSNLPTTRRFVSDHVITKFSYPVKNPSLQGDMYATVSGTDQSSQGDIYAIPSDTYISPKSFQIYNMQNALGRIIYLNSSQRDELVNATNSIGNIASLQTGFYMVSSYDSNTECQTCEYLCKPSIYALYYCTSGDGSIGHFPEADSYQALAVGGESVGTGDYVEATEADINSLNY